MDSWQTPGQLFDLVHQKQQIGQTKTRELFCYNPQCLKEITDGMVGYDREHREIYCSDNCLMMANALRCFRTAEAAIVDIDWITVSQAMKLKRTDQLH